MDEQLKRRLVGATITVALLVIFVPMLFEGPEGPAGGGGEVPALPETIEERTIELPKSADDIAQEAETKKPDKTPRSGYRIIPLEDAPPKPAKTEPPPPAQKVDTQGTGEAAPTGGEDFAEETRESPAEEPADEPAPPVTQEKPPRKPKAAAEADYPATAPKTAEAQASAPAQPKPKGALTAKSTEVPAKKKEKAKLADTTVKKAPPAAKPEAAAPKSASPKPSPTAEAVKPAEAASSGESSPAKPAPKIPSPDTARAPAKPAPAQEAPAPTSWTVQAGTFTAESNARALADKLRKQNLPAVVRPSRGENATVYRVTIGPETSRARADQIVKQVEAAVGIRGIVLPRR